MRVRRAKSAKIGKTLTAFLIPGADGDTVTVARQIVVQSLYAESISWFNSKTLYPLKY